ncbi:MAG: hypothetical protein U9O98_01005 [Asgard group archaeon]|nr:hypothetical protein [Asgard group archaeon]
MNPFLQFLEKSWLFFIFAIILFVFIIVYRDMKEYTKKSRPWQRSPYKSYTPIHSLTFQHYYLRHALLTRTASSLCKNILIEMMDYYQNKTGSTAEEIKQLLNNKELLTATFQDESLVNFLYDYNSWLSTIKQEKSSHRLIQLISKIFYEQGEYEQKLYIQLAYIIKRFRTVLENR